MRTSSLLILVCLLLVPIVPARAEPPASDDLDIQWYGFFKLDLAYDSAVSSHGNFIMYVKPRVQGDKTRTLNITARQTRIGVNILKADTKGKLEFDFYGGGDENKNILMLRKAFVDIPLGPIWLRAGQDSDLISPLVASTLNYTVAWGAGNIGYRRPQVRLYGAHKGLDWALAVSRNISGDLNGDSVLDGEASSVPVLQARLASAFPFAGARVTLGGSAHYGVLDSPGAEQNAYDTWSVNADLRLELTPSLTLLGETYTGANTGGYFGAILNGDCVHNLESRGGWVNLQYQATPAVALSAGGGIDKLTNVSDTYLSKVTNARSRNAFIFGNFTYILKPGVKTGLEISGWTTDYINLTDGTDPSPTDIRLQWSVQTSF